MVKPEPVGGAASRNVDVRIIAATNLDLHAEIKAGRFLNDLLYRIEVAPIRVPALRERRNDICLLVDHFIRVFARQYNKPVQKVDPQAMQILIDYNWPGQCPGTEEQRRQGNDPVQKHIHYR